MLAVALRRGCGPCGQALRWTVKSLAVMAPRAKRVQGPQPGSQGADIEVALFSAHRLSNLFHGMDKNTPVRYAVYCSLVRVAASCGAIQYVPTELDQVCGGLCTCGVEWRGVCWGRCSTERQCFSTLSLPRLESGFRTGTSPLRRSIPC